MVSPDLKACLKEAIKMSNDNICEKEIYSKKRVSIWTIIKYALQGAPFSLKRMSVSWKSIYTPRWSVFISLLGATLYIIPIMLAQIMQNLDKKHLISLDNFVDGFTSVLFYACFVLLFNLFMCFCLMLVLKLFSLIARTQVQVTVGAQRVNYFSTLLQPVLFLGPGLSMAHTSGFFIPDWVAHSAVIATVIAGIGRLLIVLYGMQRETDGCIWVSLLGLIPCLDVWLIFWWIFTLY